MPIYYPQVSHQIGGNTSGATANISSGTYLLAGGSNITLSQNSNSVTIIGAAGGGGGGGSFSAGVSTMGDTAGTTGTVSQQVVFVGNNITLSQSANAGSATITFHIDPPAAPPAALSAGMSNLGSTAGTTGIAQQRLIFVGNNGIGLSQSGDNSSATITISPGPYLQQFAPFGRGFTSQSTILAASLQFTPFEVHYPVTASKVKILGSYSYATATSGTTNATIQISMGIFTYSGSTLSLASSGSQSYTLSNTSNAHTSLYAGGIRCFTVPLNMNLTPGNYVFGLWASRSGTGSMSFLVNSAVNVQYYGLFGVASNSSNQIEAFRGIWSNTSFTTAMPNSIHSTNVRGGAALANYVNCVYFLNTGN